MAGQDPRKTRLMQGPTTRKQKGGLGNLPGKKETILLRQIKKKKKKQDIEKVVDDTGIENVFSNFKTGLKKAEKQYKDIPSGMKKNPETDAEIKVNLLKSNRKDPFKEFKDTRREVFGTQRYAKGGRAGYKSGSMCKLATKGKGRAYGKNS